MGDHPQARALGAGVERAQSENEAVKPTVGRTRSRTGAQQGGDATDRRQLRLDRAPERDRRLEPYRSVERRPLDDVETERFAVMIHRNMLTICGHRYAGAMAAQIKGEGVGGRAGATTGPQDAGVDAVRPERQTVTAVQMRIGQKNAGPIGVRRPRAPRPRSRGQPP